MGTKRNPGEFDCYAAADIDEPMFVLLGRDPLAPAMVRIWAAIRGGQYISANRYMAEAFSDHANDWDNIKDDKDPKQIEARSCAVAMDDWRKAMALFGQTQ